MIKEGLRDIISSKLDRRKLSKLGKRIVDEFDDIHTLDTKEDKLIASRIIAISNMINNCESYGTEWGIDTDKGLPYAYPIFDENDEDY